MANKKITQLTAQTEASTDDMMPIVDDPLGTAETKRITFDNLQKSVDHTTIKNIGTNTHAQIDTALTRLANTSGTNTGDQVIPDQLSDLSDDATHRLVTDTEKSTWNAKQAALTEGTDYLNKTHLDAAYEAKNSNIQSHISNTSNPHTVTKTQVGLGNVTDVAQMPSSYLDTDGTLAANSDTKVPSQKAVKTYADALIAANDAMQYKGAIDCSTNPNYPAASAGHAYKISVAGKIGGASGLSVEAGDLILCIADNTSAGTQAAVGAYWDVVQVNIDGAVVGPASSTDGHVATFDGITGKLIKDSGVTLGDSASKSVGSTSGTVCAGDDSRLSDARTPTSHSHAESDITNLTTDLGNKVTANVSITGATKTKVTYDAKGLVTSGADATTADIADSTNKRYVTDAQLTVIGNTSGTNTGDQTLSGLGGVAANTAITGATKTKITYDAKGLVTAGADATQDDIGDGTTYKQFSETEKTKLSGIETAADVTDATNVSAAGAVMKTGNETVAGVKTFSSFPVSPSSAPTTDYQLANKKYVDDAITAGGGYTDEQAQDAVGNILSNTGNVDFTYDDANGSITANATITKSDVGLGNVTNDAQVKSADKASQSEAETGTDDTKWVTPLKVKQAIDTFAGSAGEANTASNLGAGSGVYSGKSGVDLQFKSLVAGSNITLTPGTNDITIAASGGGATWTAAGETLTYASANGITVGTGAASKYHINDKLKFEQTAVMTSYWPLDANSNDGISSNNGTDTSISYSAGKFSNAATFNGSSSKIVFADATTLKPTGPFTFGMWFKTSTLDRTLFQSYSDNTNSNGIILNIGGAGVLAFSVGNNAPSAASTIPGKNYVCDGNWHYVVVTFANKYAKIYLDGNLESGGYCVAPTYAATNYPRLGVMNTVGTDGNFFNGQIDDLFFINGAALDPVYIKAKYNAATAQGTSDITMAQYVYITNVADTLLTIDGGTNFTLINSTISNPYYLSTTATGFPEWLNWY